MKRPSHWWSTFFICIVLIWGIEAYNKGRDSSFEKLKKLLSKDELNTLVHILETDIDIDADEYGVDKDDLWGVKESDITDKDDYDLLEALESLDDYDDDYSDYDDYGYDEDYDDEYPDDEYPDDLSYSEYSKNGGKGKGKNYKYRDMDKKDKSDSRYGHSSGHSSGEKYGPKIEDRYGSEERRKGDRYGSEERRKSDRYGSEEKRKGDRYGSENPEDRIDVKKVILVDPSKNGLGIKRKMGYKKLSPIPELNRQDLSEFKEKEHLYFPNGYGKIKSSGKRRPESPHLAIEMQTPSTKKLKKGYFGKIASPSSDSYSAKSDDNHDYDSLINSGLRGKERYDYSPKSSNIKRSDDYSPKSSTGHKSEDSHSSSVKDSDDYGSKSSASKKANDSGRKRVSDEESNKHHEVYGSRDSHRKGHPEKYGDREDGYGLEKRRRRRRRGNRHGPRHMRHRRRRHRPDRRSRQGKKSEYDEEKSEKNDKYKKKSP